MKYNREETEKLSEKISALPAIIPERSPLVHAITNPIAINDCANAILALGGRAIMTEHPAEAPGISAAAAALSVSISYPTDEKLKSIPLCGMAAADHGVPSVIDLVGVGGSDLRHGLAKEYIQNCRPAIIKGNASEILSYIGGRKGSDGLEAKKEDLTDINSLDMQAAKYAAFARETHSTVLITGPTDLVTDGTKLAALQNGSAKMSRITGAGCTLSCICAVMLSVCQDPFYAAAAAAGIWGICGEMAEELAPSGLGSYHMALFNALSVISGKEIKNKLRAELFCL